MANVELRWAIISARIVRVFEDVGLAGGQRVVVERLRIRVGAKQFEAVSEVLIDGGPQRIVVGISSAIHLINITQRAERMRCSALRRQNGTAGRKGGERPRRSVDAVRNQRLIDVLIQLQVGSLHSNVSNAGYPLAAESEHQSAAGYE